MTNKTIKIHDSVEITYHDNNRLYLVTAYDPVKQDEVVLLNVNDDLSLARAEIEFEGYQYPNFILLDKFFDSLNEEEISTPMVQ